uniref:Ig-like domain-containing protein n=1 Tax=Anguilla anguilla TaxID=7936 RepID=A0A0E9W3L1_ANGAN
MITWQRNGKDLDVELGETVRNGDGTFQTTSNLTVKPEDWKSQEYTCTVQHKSLKQDIVLPVKEENIKRKTDILSE